MIFLRAAPELYPELSRYERLLGHRLPAGHRPPWSPGDRGAQSSAWGGREPGNGDSTAIIHALDTAARAHRYSKYAEFAVVYNRITNALTYIRMLEKNVDPATIGHGEGPQGVLIDDVQLVLPYVDDVERVVRAAKAAARPQASAFAEYEALRRSTSSRSSP